MLEHSLGNGRVCLISGTIECLVDCKLIYMIGVWKTDVSTLVVMPVIERFYEKALGSIGLYLRWLH